MSDLPPVSLPDQLRRAAARDEAAAADIFHRYLQRLTALARVRIAQRFQGRFDADDVAASAFRSFFVALRNGRLDLQESQDLWRVLVTIALRKVSRQVERHSAAGRNVRREGSSLDELAGAALDGGPSPDEVVATAEAVEVFLTRLDVDDRSIAERTLQGSSAAEIAAELKLSERTVRRRLESMRRRLHDDEDAESAPMAEVGAILPSGPPPSAFRMVRPAKPGPSLLPARLPRYDYRDLVLQQMIGSGGSGKVYRAHQRSTGDLVAVKFLRKPLANDALAAAQLLREAELLNPLQIPGVVPFRGIGQAPHGLFLVMDLISGRSLSEVARSGPTPWTQVVDWLLAAANILRLTHAQDVVHCDIQPANLLLDLSGQLWITDFGHARSISSTHLTGLQGTLAYLPPERVLSPEHQPGPDDDLYGLAAVGYCLLSGRPPYDGRTFPRVLAQLASPSEPPSLVELGCRVPAELCQFFMDSLNRDLARRPRSIDDWQQRLRKLDRPDG